MVRQVITLQKDSCKLNFLYIFHVLNNASIIARYLVNACVLQKWVAILAIKIFINARLLVVGNW
jgi:hypothetical protein